MKNILFVGAHHDDLELAIGGSVRRWVDEGKKVCSAILTNSEWVTPSGKIMCPYSESLAACEEASKILGYKPYNLNISRDFELKYEDSTVVKLLHIIEEENIDTIVTIWQHDAHPVHQVVAQHAFAASRKVPNILTTRLSWNAVPYTFKPSYFIETTKYLETKLAALRCYKSEYKRIGHEWERFVHSTGILYGLESCCEFAEGLEIVRLRHT